MKENVLVTSIDLPHKEVYKIIAWGSKPVSVNMLTFGTCNDCSESFSWENENFMSGAFLCY